MTDTSDTQRQPLPVGATGRASNGWYGMWGLIATEAALFGFLLFAYYYLLFHSDRPWPPDGLPSLHLAGPNTVLLLLSSVVAWLSERAIKRGARWLAALGLAGTLALGTVFLVIQGKEWADKTFTFNDHPYGALYFTITAFHSAHVLGGLVILAALLAWTLLGYFDARRNAFVTIGTLYWHFVDVVWLFVFSTLYLSPYLLR